MSGTINSTGFENSYSAVQKYLTIRPQNNIEHKVTGVISSNGRTRFNGFLSVRIELMDKRAIIRLSGDSQFERDFYCEYTNENCTFTLINGALIIKGKDIWGTPIEIDIS